jgi:type IV pilus assembly protein PilA
MLARMQKSLKEKDQGFTLIELLVVIVIIGILAAIAIPIFLNQQKKGVDAGVKSDLKQLANLEETYYVDNSDYTAAANLAAVEAAFTDFKGTSGNDFVITLDDGTGGDGGYCIQGVTAADMRWKYDTQGGGLSSGTCP